MKIQFHCIWWNKNVSGFIHPFMSSCWIVFLIDILYNSDIFKILLLIRNFESK